MKVIRKVKVKKLVPGAVIPVPSEGNVGFDVSATEAVVLRSGQVTKVPTGIAFADNLGHAVADAMSPVLANNSKVAGVVPFFKVEGRSGLASRGIFPVGGIIDPSYRGEVIVLLFNSTADDYSVKVGDRVAQLVCYHTLAPLGGSQIEFQEVTDLVESDRGDKGFGSTGM